MSGVEEDGPGARAEGGSLLHIIIQGPRLIKTPPYATQFPVLHRRAGSSYCFRPTAGQITSHSSPARTSHVVPLTTRLLKSREVSVTEAAVGV